MTDTAVGGLESAASPGRPRRDRFPCFDGLRAVAALSVVLVHVAFATGATRGRTFGPYLARMDVGVAVFFLISGFLLYRPFVMARFDDRSPLRTRAFLRRRVLRIFPAYWVVLTVIVYVFHLHKPFDAKGFVAYYGLVHIYSPTYVLGPVGQAWTLATELAFYAFVPAWAWLMRRTSPPERTLRTELIGVGALYAASVVFRLGVYTFVDDVSWTGTLQTWLPAWLDLFALGMGLAVVSAWTAHRRLRPPAGLDHPAAPAVCWALAVLSFWAVSTRIGLSHTTISFTHPQELGRQFLFGTTAFFLLLPAIFGPQGRGLIRRFLRNRVVQLTGLVSYGIYLWHELWIQKYQDWSHTKPFSGGMGTTLVPALALAVVSATLSYVLVERPALRLKERRPARRMAH